MKGAQSKQALSVQWDTHAWHFCRIRRCARRIGPVLGLVILHTGFDAAQC
jgi:hypothetical protein